MILLGAEDIEKLLDIASLIDALDGAFREPISSPERSVVEVPGASDRLLLTMPAFQADGSGAVKLATVFPDNRAAGLPMIQGAILVFDPCGRPEALLDGASITRLRTAAASALASRYLSHPDSETLLVIGTGALAPYLAAAHAVVRPVSRISVWGRSSLSVDETVQRIRTMVAPGVHVMAAKDLPSAVGDARIISCATSAAEPVLCGEWIGMGAYVDLVGSFSPSKRECDDDAVRRASIYVDTFAGAMGEAGDILQPLARGVISRADVLGELADIVCGRARPREDRDITLFKSVGTAVEDLVASRMTLDLAKHQSVTFEKEGGSSDRKHAA